MLFWFSGFSYWPCLLNERVCFFIANRNPTHVNTTSAYCISHSENRFLVSMQWWAWRSWGLVPSLWAEQNHVGHTHRGHRHYHPPPPPPQHIKPQGGLCENVWCGICRGFTGVMGPRRGFQSVTCVAPLCIPTHCLRQITCNPLWRTEYVTKPVCGPGSEDYTEDFNLPYWYRHWPSEKVHFHLISLSRHLVFPPVFTSIKIPAKIENDYP